jgi:hypothetical protein
LYQQLGQHLAALEDSVHLRQKQICLSIKRVTRPARGIEHVNTCLYGLGMAERHYQVKREYREATEHLLDILERYIAETRTHTIYSTVL